jgi:predicted secreted protein
MLGNMMSILRLLLLLLVAVGNVFFCVTSVLPQWQSYQQLDQSVAEQREAVQTRDLALSNEDSNSIIRERIASAEEQRLEAASSFLTDQQAETILNNLYSYADESSVLITRMQAQDTIKGEADVYEQRSYAFQVEGAMRYLMHFIAYFREANAASVRIISMNLQGKEEFATLTMTVMVYESKFAGGDALEAAMEFQPPTIMPTPTPTETFTPTPTVTITSTLWPTSDLYTPTPIGTPPAPLDAPTPIPTIDAVITGETECPGAPPTTFKPGDTVVVDFNELGALRLLTWITGGATDTLLQAYDNERLLLLTGPVCGQWLGADTWYWYVESNRVRGWAAEGTATDRWLCPANLPECVLDVTGIPAGG